jgi:hypothetical protein
MSTISKFFEAVASKQAEKNFTALIIALALVLNGMLIKYVSGITLPWQVSLLVIVCTVLIIGNCLRMAKQMLLSRGKSEKVQDSIVITASDVSDDESQGKSDFATHFEKESDKEQTLQDDNKRNVSS